VLGVNVFISYSRKDRRFVRRLTKDLERYGFAVWIDEKDIRVGSSIAESIRVGIERSDYFLVVISENSSDSPWVRRELDVALNAEMSGRIRSVLPLMVGTITVPSLLEGKLYADFRHGKYVGPLRSLLQALGFDEQTVGVLAGSIIKGKYIDGLIQHLRDEGFSSTKRWKPMQLRVEIDGGYLTYMRGARGSAGKFATFSPLSPLPLNTEWPILRRGGIQIGFGHMRVDYLGDADQISGLSLPTWRNIIFIGGPSVEVRSFVSSLLASGIRLGGAFHDLTDVISWWSNQHFPSGDDVSVTAMAFGKEFVVRARFPTEPFLDSESPD